MGDEEVRQPQGGEVVSGSMRIAPAESFLSGGIRNQKAPTSSPEVVLVKRRLISWHGGLAEEVDGELPANRHSLYQLILTHRHSEDLSSTLDPDPPMTKPFPT